MKTEGIKYAGSKNKLIPLILNLIKPLKVQTVLDGFAGTTRVSQALKKSGYTVFCNDIAVWSRVFGRCYLLNKKSPDHYSDLIEHLNGLEGKDGWFSEHYGGVVNSVSTIQVDGKKRLWQIHNTRKLDAIRHEIDRIADGDIEKSVLLTSLILAMDKVDSSLGHQVSYLKNWSERSYNTMKMMVPRLIVDKLPHRVHNKNTFDFAAEAQVDLAYFDPPYGSSNKKMPSSRVRYASYYHLWKTIILNDEPKVVGAANRREDASDKNGSNVFEDFRRGASGRYVVVEAIEKLLRTTKAKYILLSYSNGGRATLGELKEIVDDLKCESILTEVDHFNNVMAQMKWTDKWTNGDTSCKEYLFLISK